MPKERPYPLGVSYHCQLIASNGRNYLHASLVRKFFAWQLIICSGGTEKPSRKRLETVKKTLKSQVKHKIFRFLKYLNKTQFCKRVPPNSCINS